MNQRLVVSFFPKLNTKVCDLQTLKISELVNRYPAEKFVAISLDPISVGKEWLQVHQVKNLTLLSDAKMRDFASQTGLLTADGSMLLRGLMLIDADQRVVALSVNQDLKVAPDYQAITKFLDVKN
ncbi:redoxin domain-containing protein [Mycoplasma sp. ATU-Cv-508]|uniref:redoxin domain-containing protein n=1 Tax=Mycoplasma sp. ATU-Cv-508 TaxID=2048001 RepID=UPI00191BA81D